MYARTDIIEMLEDRIRSLKTSNSALREELGEIEPSRSGAALQGRGRKGSLETLIQFENAQNMAGSNILGFVHFW